VKRNLTLCADDFGQSAAIDRGILRLAASGRLNAVSCLVGGASWASGARELLALPTVARGQVRLGLHFNLTEGRPVSSALFRHWPHLPGLHRLIVQSHLRALPLAALREEWRAQFGAFEQVLGRRPDHVDGHQHVHHLPQLRAQLLEQMAARPTLRARHTGRILGPGHPFKRWVIAATGGRALGRRLETLGRQQNTMLLGVYDFGRTPYQRLMQQWLQALPEQGGLIFCHPGAPPRAQDGGAHSDPIGPARARELAYLESPAFQDDLLHHEAQLA
jgi:predicted glycoside hydrolase/deacetylase ChbG (UPF0249 family)